MEVVSASRSAQEGAHPTPAPLATRSVFAPPPIIFSNNDTRAKQNSVFLGDIHCLHSYLKVIICAAVFAATSTHPGFFLYLQSLRLLVLCVLLAMWFSSGLLLHTLSRKMTVVGWNLLAHSNQTFTLLINVDLLFVTSSPFLMTILLTQKEASIIPDILWYMLTILLWMKI